MNLKPIAVLHIPHASKVIPQGVRQKFLLSDKELDDELIKMTDSFTDELFDSDSPAIKVISPVSRLVIDVERFIDDADEPMAKRGMGVIYTKTSSGQPLRHILTAEDRRLLLKRYYDPHHQKFTKAVKETLSVNKCCLIIDCHSFPSTPLSYESDPSPTRPNICIGTDEFHTPSSLKELTMKLFRESGFSIEIDTPYSGSMVPGHYYHSNANIKSIMIEVNRSLYMEEKTGVRNHQFEQMCIKIRDILGRLIAEFTT